MLLNPLQFSDKNNTPLSLGDKVIGTKGKHNGLIYTFVFCIPQHRFGFTNRYEEIVKHNGSYGFYMLPEPFVVNIPSLDFYYTPKNKEEMESLAPTPFQQLMDTHKLLQTNITQA
jgi:hypothetical protein